MNLDKANRQFLKKLNRELPFGLVSAGCLPAPALGLVRDGAAVGQERVTGN